MKITETVELGSRSEWRTWLSENYDTTNEIWLVSHRKATGRLSVRYNDAVEEALCFGWIDSIRKSLDEERFAQRFTPRKRGSSFSQTNRERLARLLAEGQVIPAVAAQVRDVRPDDFRISQDILAALQARSEAWEFFRNTSPSYQRIRAAYVDVARARPDEFARRLQSLVDKSARGRQFGYGIEDYY